MPLTRFVKVDLWKNYSASADEITNEQDVSKVSHIGAFIKVSATTIITLEVETTEGWEGYRNFDFTGIDRLFLNIWAAPFGKIRFRTSNAAIITIQVMLKT